MSDDVLGDHYQLGEALGQSVWLATDRRTDALCVAKELTLGRVTDWKQIDLFEREANTLRQLSHPGIPEFVDSFRTDADVPRFYLVHSFLDGESLAGLIESGPLPETEVVEIATGVLELLVYLQGFSPPVLHRDITPDSIVRRADGTYALVDFGSVQVELRGTMGGSTIVGTTGYMPPEQLMGRAVPGSDVYSLGMSLIEALTGVAPANLPMDRMKPRWRHHAPDVSPRLLDVIDRMVEPNREERFEDAKATLRAFGRDHDAMVRASDNLMATRPAATDIAVKRTAKRLVVKVPHRRASVAATIGVLLAVGLAATAIASIILISNISPWTLAIILVLFIGTVGAIRPRSRPDASIELDVDRGFRVKTASAGKQLRAGPFGEVVGVAAGSGRQKGSLFLATADRLFELARLTENERDWLKDEIEDFIEHQRGTR